MVRVGIIGGGIGGLGAAYELAKQGHQVAVYERAPFLGGLAAPFDIGGGRLERFYHHLFLSDRTIIDLLEELATRSLQLFCLALAPAGASVLLSTFFQAIGRGLPALILSFARQLGFILPLVLILPRFLGLDGLFLAQPLSDVAAFVITVVWALVQFRQLGIPVLRRGA